MGRETENLDDKTPFGQSFEKKILQEDTPSRSYALTGSPVKASPDEAESPDIERVDFDFSQFEKQSINAVEIEEEETDAHSEKTQTEFNNELDDPDEIALNKKVQAKLAKGQAKNIAGIYVMILKAAWKWIGKYREDKLNIMHIRGEIDVNIIIRQHPFIEHIRNMNNEVDEWELDSDSIEAIVDALEIFLISQNIQTSPGMNLAMAMGVPAIEMLAKAWGHKREMKSLVAAVSEMHQQNKTTLRKQNLENSKMSELQKELAEQRAKNEAIMKLQPKTAKSEAPIVKKTDAKKPTSRGKTSKPAKASPFPVKKHEAAVVESDETITPKPKENGTDE